jgi:hypothetical protein
MSIELNSSSNPADPEAFARMAKLAIAVHRREVEAAAVERRSQLRMVSQERGEDDAT